MIFEKKLKGRRDSTKTIAEMLLYLDDPDRRLELEQFRKDYEAHNAKTDLTKRYTSTWSKEDQEILRKLDPKRYFDGFPPFAQEYLRKLLTERHKVGMLDDTPDDLLELFLRGELGSSQYRKGQSR